MNANDLFTWLLRPPAPLEATTLEAFVGQSRRWLDDLAVERPVDRAIGAGVLASGVGFAFVGGYREALQAMVPSLPRGEMAALCVTEEGGGHPRAIRTSVRREADGSERVTGVKRWATAAGSASRLLVAVSRGLDAAGRNRLGVAQVEANRPGVRLEAMAPTPFCPEVPHYVVHLDGVRVEASDWLPGDGYASTIRPFRTVEDVHVTAAVAAHALAVASRLGLDREARGELVAVVAALRAGSSGSGEVGALALDAWQRQAARAFDALEPGWRRADAASAERWQRDRPLLQIAGAARAARTRAAWQTIEGSAGGRGDGGEASG